MEATSPIARGKQSSALYAQRDPEIARAPPGEEPRGLPEGLWSLLPDPRDKGGKKGPECWAVGRETVTGEKSLRLLTEALKFARGH